MKLALGYLPQTALKLFVVGLCLVSIGTFLAHWNTVSANTTVYENFLPNQGQNNEALLKELTGCKYGSQGLAQNLIDVGGQLAGTSTFNYPDYLCATVPGAATTARLEELRAQYLQGGGGIGTVITNVNIALLDQRPASAVDFVLARVENTLSPGTVYAAEPAPYFPGTGFVLLTPIQSFWGWSVTIAYSFMIIIILIVAFGLMFQLRLDGKTVVQLQQAIPGIVLAMILIPLTYPVAGLFIDAITLGTNVYHDFLLGPSGPGSEVYKSGAAADQSSFNTLRGLYADDWRISVFRVREFISTNQLGNVVGAGICPEQSGDASSACGQSGINILGLVNSIVKFVTADQQTLSSLVGSLLNLIFSIIFIVISFKIAYRLLMKFFVLLFFPIILPFMAATVALPGRGTQIIVDQLKVMAAASLQYIVTYAIFLTVIVVTNPVFIKGIPNAQTYQFNVPLLGASRIPDLINSTTSNLNSTGLTGFLFTLIGIAMFLSLPNILDGIDKALNVPEDLIPAFLKPAVAEFKSAYDIGFRQAPAVVRSGASQIGAGATSVLSSRFIGGRRPGGAFSDTAGEEFVSKEKAALSNLRSKQAAAGNVFTRGYYGTLASARQNFYSNPLATAQGQAGKITPKTEEKGSKIEIRLVFNMFNVESRFQPDNFSYQISDKQLTTILGRTRVLDGTLVIKAAEGTTKPLGNVFVQEHGANPSGPGYIIGSMKTSRGGPALIVIDPATVTFRNAGPGVLQITDTKKTFSGGDEVSLDVKLYDLNADVQVWSPDKKTNVAVGTSASSDVRKGGGMTLRVTPS